MAKLDKNRHNDLTIEQENAIDLLVMGKTDQEAAEAVGVSRQTVNEWRNQNAFFLARLNQRRAELWEADISRLRSLVSEAIDVLAADLRSDDIKAKRAAAVHLLRAVGIYGANAKPDGETSAAKIERESWLV